MYFKRLLSVFLSLFCLGISVVPMLSVSAAAPELSSKSAIVYSLNSGDVIFEKDADLSLAPASLTKITTTMTVLSLCSDPDNTLITVPDAGLFDEITAVGGSNIDLVPGETLSVTELLYAVMLPSACDACNVLAYHFGNGSVSAFVAKMNEWALSAGATRTNFQNAHGLDAPGHKSSARDTAKIILKALENERFFEIVNTLEIVIPENEYHARRYINYQSTIPMLYNYNSEYYKGMAGIKSGYTLEAKCCLSSMAERDGEAFLAVCLGAEKSPQNMARVDTAALYDWAFENFETQTLLSAGEILKTVPLSGATTETCELVLDEDFVVCANTSAGEITLSYEVEAEIGAPFSAESAGTVSALQGSTVLATRALSFKSLPVAAPVSEGETVQSEIPSQRPNIVTLVGIIVIVLLVLLAFAVFALSRPPKQKARPLPTGLQAKSTMRPRPARTSRPTHPAQAAESRPAQRSASAQKSTRPSQPKTSQTKAQDPAKRRG